jgi:helix-turn-helix protein
MPVKKKYVDESDGNYFSIEHFVKEKTITFFYVDSESNEYTNICLSISDIKELHQDLSKILEKCEKKYKSQGGKNG